MPAHEIPPASPGDIYLTQRAEQPPQAIRVGGVASAGDTRGSSIKFSSRCPANTKVLLDFFQKIAGVQGTESLFAHRNGRNLYPAGAFLKSEFESSRWGLSKRKTFCKKKSFSDTFRMLFPFCFPVRKTKISWHQEPCRAPFFLQKGPSCKISHWDILQFTSENAPCGKRVSLPVGSNQEGLWSRLPARSVFHVCHWQTTPP